MFDILSEMELEHLAYEQVNRGQDHSQILRLRVSEDVREVLSSSMTIPLFQAKAVGARSCFLYRIFFMCSIGFLSLSSYAAPLQ